MRITTLVVLAALAHSTLAQTAITSEQATQTIAAVLASTTPSQSLSCSLNITGNFTNAEATNTTGSTNVKSAAVSCTGGTLELIGGPALGKFNSSFSGVNYVLDYSLPGATVAIREQEVTFVNSNLVDLTPDGEASIILIASNVTFQTANFSSNKQATAGAIRANQTSNIAILNSTFLNNTGSIGGAISIYNSSVFINGSTFVNNTGQQGGAVLFQNGSASAMRIASTVFRLNNATTGGAVFAQECSQSIFYNNVFDTNRASGSGGGIFQLNCGGAMVLNALLSNNASAGGGAYINTVTGLTLNLNEWTGNTADTGSGGLDLQTVQEASITNDTFAKNKGQQGGGYFGTDTSCSFANATFTGNKATLNGGAIFRTQGSGDITTCNFTSNVAGQLGGAVYDSQVAGNIEGNTFSGNQAGTAAAAAVFRLQSAGAVTSSNEGLSNNFEDLSPNSTSTSVAG